jgi:hypothetical protein
MSLRGLHSAGLAQRGMSSYQGFGSERILESIGGIMMRAKQVACCFLLVATVGASGCLKEHDLVGRWEAGRWNFYFREDGVLFYRSASGTKYQGKYHYDDSTEPGIVRAELQAIGGDGDPISLEFRVTFLSRNSIRFDRENGGRNRSLTLVRT